MDNDKYNKVIVTLRNAITLGLILSYYGLGTGKNVIVYAPAIFLLYAVSKIHAEVSSSRYKKAWDISPDNPRSGVDHEK